MQEKQKKWMLRIALYLVGIIVLALGITLNTKTNLGVSPIISMPYAVAQIFGYETGTAVFVAYLIFIVLQIVLLKGKFRPFQLLQVAASYLTSAFITIFDRVLPVPEQMGSRLLVLALAIILTGIGAAVTVDVNIVPNPADGLARVLGERCGKNMGFGKNLFDFSALVISLAIGMIGAGRPVGIGAAVTVDVNIVPNPADGLARVLGERCGKNMGFGKNLFDFSALVISLAIGMIGAGRPVGIGSGTVVAMVCTGRVIALFNYFGKKKIEEITIA